MPKYWLLSLMFVALLLAALSGAAQTPAPDPAAELQKLDVSTGRWIFHGQTMSARSGQPGTFTWNEDCAWSPNHMFLECTFDNDWAGRTAHSLVVDTYNSNDHNFWHYEMFSVGERGDHPFVSRMTIDGNTWVEYGPPNASGQTTERITYNWTPPDRVAVTIETSKDGTTWTTVDKGEGIKQH